jgi:heparan-alpha-glucosaminide N-acetyltransferase
MTNTHRFHSIDITKGFLILLILFVNAWFLPALPPWISNIDTLNSHWDLAGWVFPAFLFMAGMTIPFAISKKINSGLTPLDISKQILTRFIVLITVGVLLVNGHRADSELTGFSKYLWSFLAVAGIFLVWNRYPEKEDNFFTVTGLRFLGLAILVFLIFKFKSGSPENNGSLITGWWDIPGLFGWGYLVSAFTFRALRNSIAGTTIIWLVFLSVNILSYLNMLEFLNQAKPYVGVIIAGHIPLILLSGHLAGLVLKRYSDSEYRKIVIILFSMSIIIIVTGFVLKNWIFTAGIFGNPGIALLSSGVTLLLYTFVYWFADVKKNDRWFAFFKPAGENPLTVYIAPGVVYSLIYLAGFQVLFFKNSASLFLGIAGSAIWAIILFWLASLLIRLNIRLKI